MQEVVGSIPIGSTIHSTIQRLSIAAGHDLINNDGPATAAKLRARIKFLEFELAATHKKLSELEETSP